MYQTIGEKISVAGVFSQGNFRPTAFVWGKKKYPIKEITLQSNVRNGQVRSRLYSVVAEHTVFRLRYQRENEIWTLEEIWHEGA